MHYNLKHYVGNDILDEDKFEIIGNIYDKEDEQRELNQCNDCKEIKKLKDELELTETNYKILLDKANDALLELNAQLLEDNEKNKKYISNLQTYLEKMNGQRDRAIEKLMNNMSLSPDELREIIRG